MKKNILKSGLLTAILLITVAVNAQGRRNMNGSGQSRQSQKPNAEKIMSMLDTNNDNKIDIEEASQAKRGKMAERFDMLDSNEDGFIDLEELKSGKSDKKTNKERMPRPEKIFEAVDNNKDVKLDALEVAAKEQGTLKEHFSDIDANADGFIDMDELKAYQENIKDKHKKEKEGSE